MWPWDLVPGSQMCADVMEASSREFLKGEGASVLFALPYPVARNRDVDMSLLGCRTKR